MAESDYIGIDDYEEDVTGMELDPSGSLMNTEEQSDKHHEINETMSEDLCIFCKRDTGEHVSVLARGTKTFLNHCRDTGHTELANYVATNSDLKLMLHGSCRRALAYEASKAVKEEAAAKTTPQRLTRSVTGSFSFKDMCFLCGESLSGVASHEIRNVLSGDDFDRRMRDVIRERGFDDWALAVQGRMDTVCDLFSADAVYHKNCHVRFIGKLCHTPCKVKRGRPRKVDAMDAFDRLCDKLEAECDNELYTLSQLHDMLCDLMEDADDSTAYGRDYLKTLLEKRYGNHIYFASRPGRNDVVGFKNFCDLVVHNKFFSERNEGQGTEAEKLVHKAAGLILAEIREMECNRKFFPTPDDIAGDGMKFVPSLLGQFLTRLIRSPVKQAGIGQAIVQATRPQGSIMPLLFAIAVDLDQCGVQQVQTKLSRVGFSLTTDEVNRYKQSVMQTVTETTDSTDNEHVPVVNYVADNVDHNTRTLDGLNTFHGMGIISATVVPIGSVPNKQKGIPRLEKRMKASEATSSTCVPIVPFYHSSTEGVSSIRLCPIQSLQRPVELPIFHYLNSVWHAAGMVSPSGHPRPNWSGYMQSICEGEHAGVSTVEMLSMVDLNPSDEDCIYSTLLYVINHAKCHGIQTPNITFDQPLYIKAVDISMRAGLDIVVRLGGFHTLMSFLGSVGHLMKGSGLENVLGLILGPNTVEHVLSGKAYARAIRGHFLIHAALTDILLDYLRTSLSDVDEGRPQPVVIILESAQNLAGSFSHTDMAAVDMEYEQIVNGKVNVDDSRYTHCESVSKLNRLLEDLKHALSEQSRTSRLWLLCMKCIDVVKLFILADRTSNWPAHIHAVKRMISLFAATGHVHYAKSARLYVQQMENLPLTHPHLHQQFLDGHHSIRRTDRYWAGLPPDLVIEQTMMRAVKSRGGLTRGRGMHETVRNIWLNTLTQCASVRAALSQVTGTERSTPEHVEVGVSRMRRDLKDLYTVKYYLQQYSPFRFRDSERLVSLSSGVVAGSEDLVNCDHAEEIGHAIQMKWDNCVYGEMTCKKAEQVKTLAYLTNACSVGTDKVHIDPSNLFHRLVLVGERTNNLRQCFVYELTPYPMSLFKDGFMRKPNKPSLYREFTVGLTDAPLPSPRQYVVDGGYLLHKVRWNAAMNMHEVLLLFSNYLHKFGSTVHVVFDGYGSRPSTKDHEHTRRAGKLTQTAPERQVDENTKDIGHQELFLSNTANKKSFIDTLMPHLQRNGFAVYQAESDADTLIVSVALDCARCGIMPVAVLAEDTDILIMLLHHRKLDMADMYFVSEAKKGRGGKMVGGKCISIRAVQEKIGLEACERILAVHAFGGCDTTSAIFGHGKGKIFNMIVKDKDCTLHSHCMTLQSRTASVEEVCTAGTQLMIALYGGKPDDKLAVLRYEAYCSTSLSRRFQPERLPPSQTAAQMHAMRVHLQSVTWATLDNDEADTCLKATDWGWKLDSNHLAPIHIIGDIAPEIILTVVRCKCKTDCSSTHCSCRKNGLHCVSACGNCRGTDCSNVRTDVADTDGSDTESEPDTSDIITEDVDMPDFLWDDDLNFFYEEEV